MELKFWKIYTKLIPFMKNIKDENSVDFIPIEDRMAIFDLDGTLVCETDPTYFDFILYTYRVLDDLIIRIKKKKMKI